MGEPLVSTHKAINFNIKGKEKNTFDAIVVGSGMSGGWAAKELTEKGLKTLVLERGRNVEHIEDYPTAFKNPWEFPHAQQLTSEFKSNNPVKSIKATEANEHFFLDDDVHPYSSKRPFNWIRGYQVGGRSLTWGRNCYRMSDLDFEANLKEGIAVDWPIRYKDIAPWYSYVEKFVGISGRKEGLAHLPDGEFLPDLGFNAIENYFAQELKKNYSHRILTPSRVANLTQQINDRGPCQYRNACDRGCPFKGYFCSNTSTLPAAGATGNMWLRPFSVTTHILYSKEQRRATGVRVVDTNTLESTEYFADLIFVNASTINTAAILLNSRSEVFPDGLGNNYRQVGHNLIDHFVTAGAEGEFEGFQDRYYSGRTPGSVYIPRFRNINKETETKDFLRGYAYQGYGERKSWNDKIFTPGVGKTFKENFLKPGDWSLLISGWGETLPYYHNHISLDRNRTDKWGMPMIHIDFKFGDNESKMREDMISAAEEMLAKSGFKNIRTFNYERAGGSAIHEMGTARMGHDPRTSVLNKLNQMHDVPNVFITDGSCMTSSGTQNPSITYMALTARACHHAVEMLKKREI